MDNIIALDNNEVISLREKHFELHCMQMKLVKNNDNNCSFSGPGLIKQTSDGQLKFIMYAIEKNSIDKTLDEIFCTDKRQIGKIIPKTCYFQFSAIDNKGREWTANHILPDRNYFKDGILFEGNLYEISFIRNISASCLTDSTMHLEFYNDLKIPANKYTTIKKTAGNNKNFTSELNILNFNIASYEYNFEKSKNMLQIRIVVKEKEFIENFELRIIEGLQFVLAQPLYWALLMKWTIGKVEVRIRPILSTLKQSSLLPPVVINYYSSSYFCAIFEKYMSYILIEQFGEKIHPISAQIRAICHASMGSIEAQALTISVAIESILKYIEPEKDNNVSDIDEWIKKAQDYFETWGGPAKLNDRIKGLIAQLYNKNASKKLDELIVKGVILKEQKRSWQELRNKLTHGYTNISNNYQKLIDLKNTVLVMFYFLVFYIIGYQGEYTNYSSPGWPVEKYSPLPPKS